MTPAVPPADQPADPPTSRAAAVVLAGGGSKRFGSDKLLATLDGAPLLQHAVADLPPDWQLIIVGPPRPVPRPAEFVREDPPGGGPAAGLVAGARAAVAAGATMIITLPGDAPYGSAAALVLAERLADAPGRVVAVVATDQDGVDQPLQFAVRGRALERLCATDDAHGSSARRMLDDLAAAGEVVRLPLPPALTADVDRPEDLATLPALVDGPVGQDQLNPHRT